LNNIIYCEWLKLKRSKIVTVGFWGTLIVPLLITFKILQRHIKNPDAALYLFDFFDDAMMFLMLLFAPLIMAVFAAYLISREYSEKTLKTIFTVPITRKSFLTGKFLILFMIVLLFMIVSWLQIMLLSAVCDLFFGVDQINIMSAVYFLVKMLIGGILLYMTITPVIYLSVRNKGFIVPIVMAVVICLLNVALSSTPVAGFFPWTAAYLLVSGRGGDQGCPSIISFWIIVLVFALSVAASMNRFLKEDI